MDNFQFRVSGEDGSTYHFVMNDGVLYVDGVEYEEVSCPETYALARAHYREFVKVTED